MMREILADLFGSVESGLKTIVERLVKACSGAYGDNWLDVNYAKPHKLTPWTVILADPSKMSFRDLRFYTKLFGYTILQIIPEIEDLSRDNQRNSAFIAGMRREGIYAECIGVEREPKTDKEWHEALLYYMGICLMRELNNLSGRFLQESDKLAKEIREASERTEGLQYFHEAIETSLEENKGEVLGLQV